MKLNAKELENKQQWLEAGFALPRFDREKAAKEAHTNPVWIHFGAGNIFRAFPARCWQEVLDQGLASAGIIVAEGYDYEILDAAFAPHDNLTLAVTLKADGGIDKTVVASIVEALKADTALPDFERLREVFRAPSLQMASFTITEKGYSIRQGDDIAPTVAEDFKNGPAAPKSYIGKVAALLHERYANGAHPIAMVSMDNCSHNGDKLFEAMRAFAEAWVGNGLADASFLPYVEAPDKVSFPWSMIDKITPRPDEGVKAMLRSAGFEDVEATATAKHTYVAPFVNAEETEYLIIEDRFPNGRPPLDRAGIMYTDRATVDKVEKMKVCTCLNPLHTAMSIFGCLLGHTKISEEMKDADILRLVEIIGYDEGLPVVVDPGIVNPRAFLDQVVTVRLPNPFMPDTPQRIASDTSQKLSIRFGETIKLYMERSDLDVNTLRLIPLVQAAYCRYLLGVDDKGKAFEVSPDPRYAELAAHLKAVTLGDSGPFHNALKPLLCDAGLFGIDLYQVGLGERVEGYFAEMMTGPGAVRETLHKYVSAAR